MNVIKKILTNILIYGTEFIVIMLSVFPIVWVALSSFKTNAQILEGPFTPPTGITTAKEAYTYLFQKYDFFSYFGNSLLISLISTVISPGLFCQWRPMYWGNMSSREEILFLHYLQLQCLFRVMQKHSRFFTDQFHASV